MTRFDYIIAGAGCAGLSLLVRLLQSGQFNEHKILLIDKAPKQGNDHTWCFWEKGEGLFEPIVYRSWERLWFHGNDHTKLHYLPPYRYKMIRSEDLYRYCYAIIKDHPNVTVQYEEVLTIINSGTLATLQTKDHTYSAPVIFNSILFQKPVLREKDYYLLQHFKGWVIETEKPVFDPESATLMDFRTDQQYGTAFVYVMPFSATTALVEYTLFSANLLEPDQYNEGLKEYIHQHLHTPYIIKEEEFGVIPMTSYRFPTGHGAVINIGTAGGWTKPSSGYTFQFIQQHTAELVEKLSKKEFPAAAKQPRWRFRFYDNTLLHILHHRQLPGDQLFSTLFKKNSITDLFQFLDEGSSPIKEMKIIRVLPKWVFLKAAWHQLFR